MMKDECEIICDLLPLYVDDVCAKKTCAAVEEHIAACGPCREKYEHMKNTRLVAKEANRKQIDFLRGLKKRQIVKNVAVLLAMTGILLLQLLLENHTGRDVFRLAVPAMIMAAMIALDSDNGWDKRWQYLAGATAAFLGIYEIVLNEYLAGKVCVGETVFGLPQEKLGPFLAGQMYVVLVICALVLLANWRWKKNNHYVSCLCVAVMGLSCAYDSLYHRLDTLELYLQSLRRIEIVMVLELLAALTVIILLERRKGRLRGD